MGGAMGAIITNGEVPIEGRAAVPAYVDDSLPIVGPARPVFIMTDGPKAGGPALAVRLAPAGAPAVGPALPIYLVSGSLGSAPSSLLTNLTSYWSLEEASGTRFDAVSGNDLTDNATVTQAVGKIGNSAQFTAANSEYLSHADNASLSLGGSTANGFAIACWAYFDSLGTFTGLVTKDEVGAGGTREYSVYKSGGNVITVEVFNASGGVATVSSVSGLFTATWYHIVAWWDAADSKVRVSIDDGAPVVSAGTVTPTDSTAQFGIGARKIGGTPDLFMNGRIDEVSLWKDFIPSAAQRTWMYNSGNGRAFSEYAGAP